MSCLTVAFPFAELHADNGERLSERGVSVPPSAFVPLSKRMSAHDMKTRHAVYRCSCVIHNFSSSQGD